MLAAKQDRTMTLSSVVRVQALKFAGTCRHIDMVVDQLSESNRSVLMLWHCHQRYYATKHHPEILVFAC